MSAPELVAIDLTDDERLLLMHGLNEYFGAAKRSWPLLLPLLGLSTTDEFRALTSRLMETIEDKRRLSELDWARALLLTEICWGSELLGAGLDFASNIYDEKAMPLLRAIQRKVSNHDRFALLRDNAGVAADGG
ncbi:hypothetical protein PT015_06775 [Candidatus Mycobacterium wuenschmannii]|uniref:Uncharacterized protein n=1 Tax=Candidatus Mycobacterium wuenschmannii TaxID=3027808 RepID=A0ABY8W5U1_9MYCO|nr:hypothetical protein [Candidatus Mycobacterium wuenschmannii]WIM89154.1 hypothetical protein PT015_06775 [Candidatus Mycobacterium wuenschmannii]